jgi:primosomal protein N' (replication factor Y) (superfamily II helicase)
LHKYENRNIFFQISGKLPETKVVFFVYMNYIVERPVKKIGGSMESINTLCIAKVVLINSTREFDKEYDYKVPKELEEKVKTGIRVIVPFGRANKAIEACILDTFAGEKSEGLKEIKKVLDESPVLNEKMIELVKWMKERYVCTYGDVIRCMLPPGIGVKSSCTVKLLKFEKDVKSSLIKILDELEQNGGEYEIDELKSRVSGRNFNKGLKELEELGYIKLTEEYSSKISEKTVRVAYLAQSREEILEEIESNHIKKIQQVRILEMLLDNEFISVADILRFAGVSGSVLDTLRKYGYINYKDITVNRDPLRHLHIEKTNPLNPNSQQTLVMNKIRQAMDQEAFGEYLLHGVTGSGKTEVYLQLIHYCLEKGKQAIVLVPEISLTPQMVERFKGRFGSDVAVLHSRLSLGERYDQWRLIRDGKIRVTVGARSAIFAPFENLGIIIIDEEHENSYKSETTPKYNAKDVARERCIQNGAIIVYGSATPAIETYNQAGLEDTKIELLEMTQRANMMVMPEVNIVDMRKELEDGNRSVFSGKLADEIRKNIELGQQTILFLNRRGYSSFVLCRNCGYTVICPNCNVSLTYHSHDERLICHYCGFTTRNPEICPKCKSNHIRHFGTGTQRIEEELQKQFPGCSVIRMDMDTTSYKNSHETILRAFKEKNINILVGTQMIAKGHDFPNVTLVGVLAADSLLNTGDYRAGERTFQLLTQVSGRAGRGELAGRVVIQSYNIEDFSILSACKHDYKSFYDQEIKVRERLVYPPFTNIGVVILSGLYDKAVFNKSKEVIEKLKENSASVDILILGPSRAPITKINNKYRWRIILKCKDINSLIRILSMTSDEYYRKKDKTNVDMSMDINPVSML